MVRGFAFIKIYVYLRLMPTVLRINGYRFYFFAGDAGEPVHVNRGDGYGKIWLEPQIKVQALEGFKSQEEKKILDIVENHVEELKNSWYGYFNS